MSIKLIITAGFGNGTFNGTIPAVVTDGFMIGEVIVTSDYFFSVIGLINGSDHNVIGKIDSKGQNVKGLI